MTATCAWCDAPKQSSLVCPQCGADYAKAEAIKSKGKAESVLTSSLENTLDSSVDGASDTFLEDTDSLILVKDPAFEKTVCLFALPGMAGSSIEHPFGSGLWHPCYIAQQSRYVYRDGR